MKDLTPALRRLDENWQPEVRATESAALQIRNASRLLERSVPSLWRDTAKALLAQHRFFARSTWFARQRFIELPAIEAGDPTDHPELLAPIRFAFVVQRGQPHWILGTTADFAVPASYPVQALLEEVRANAAADGRPTTGQRS